MTHPISYTYNAATFTASSPGGVRGHPGGHSRDIAILTCVGKPTSFVITGFEDGVPQLSRRRAQELALEQLLKDAVPGDILPATVTHLEPYGAFVDIGRGVPSLIPLKTISVSRIPHPNCRFRPGQQIYALVREVLPEQRRIQLSHKELLGTWTENVEAFQPGETVTGIVRSVMDYGIFVELSPNLTGLAEPLEGFLPETQFRCTSNPFCRKNRRSNWPSSVTPHRCPCRCP